MRTELSLHDDEIRRNLGHWNRKPALKKIYNTFYREIAGHLSRGVKGQVVELGSGIGNVKEVIPECLRTDIFPNPWLDRVENAYHLSFPDRSLSNIILFDVFHHLEFPGTALEECRRALCQNGRVILFEPCVSLLGLVVFGLFHHEPLNLTKPVRWFAPPGWEPDQERYHASQGNAFRIFFTGNCQDRLTGWKMVARQRKAAIAYLATGGYSKPQIFPDAAFPTLERLEKICDLFPLIFATRSLIVIEKA